MATTFIHPLHISKGETIAQSLKDRFDYGENPKKTQNKELITAYECDVESADAEFNLSKAKYKSITGREQKKDDNVIAYQIRQSFKPNEITPEEANQIGYELAMRWLKGNHAFFVATHVDKKHIHNHIYYNSTSLDCTHKFRNFYGSTFAVRRLSDRICIENNLSYVKNPKLHSKSKFKHYGQWLDGKKSLTYQEKLRNQIDICLAEQPGNFDEFLNSMKSYGYEVKHGRGGAISFRIEGQERYTRLRSSTLGDGYDVDAIKSVIENHFQKSSVKVNLIIDIQSRMREGKGPGYEHWAKIYNLKQMAAAVQYLQENNLLDYVKLENKAAVATEQFHSKTKELKDLETVVNEKSRLMGAIVNYAKTRPIFDEYKSRKYSRNFFETHQNELRIYREATNTFGQILSGNTLPKMDNLKNELKSLKSEKNELYSDYKKAKKEMQEVLTVKANIDNLFRATSKNKEMER